MQVSGYKKNPRALFFVGSVFNKNGLAASAGGVAMGNEVGTLSLAPARAPPCHAMPLHSDTGLESFKSESWKTRTWATMDGVLGARTP